MWSKTRYLSVKEMDKEIGQKVRMRADRTIAVTQETREKLRGLKRYHRETMDDIINRLLGQYAPVLAVADKKGWQLRIG